MNKAELVGAVALNMTVTGYYPADYSTIPQITGSPNLENSSAEVPWLEAEAIAAEIPLAELVDTVWLKTTALYQLEAQISGTKKKHLNAISALTDTAAVKNYDFNSGWPTIN